MKFSFFPKIRGDANEKSFDKYLIRLRVKEGKLKDEINYRGMANYRVIKLVTIH